MSEVYWPLYFAKHALHSARLALREGDPFPFQGKAQLRGLAPAYGIADGDTRAFHRLPYIQVLNVRSEAMARYVLQSGLSYADAKALLEAPPAAA